MCEQIKVGITLNMYRHIELEDITPLEFTHQTERDKAETFQWKYF